MTTKDTLAACRIQFVEGALAKLERKLEEAEGSHREALQKLVAEVQRLLRTLSRHTLH
jgi:hypothetical protein